MTLLGGPYRTPRWRVEWNADGSTNYPGLEEVAPDTWELVIPGGKIRKYNNPWGPGEVTPIIRVWATDAFEYWDGNVEELKHTLSIE